MRTNLKKAVTLIISACVTASVLTACADMKNASVNMPTKSNLPTDGVSSENGAFITTASTGGTAHISTMSAGAVSETGGASENELKTGDVNCDGEIDAIDVTLLSRYVAKWSGITIGKPEGYTVTFKDGEGNIIKTETVKSGESATPPEAPARDGYVFVGWDTDCSNVTGDITVSAKYEKVSEATSFNVTFKDYDGTVLKEEKVESGKSATAPENPTRAGYNFVGWDIDFASVLSDITVNAVYEKDTTPAVYIDNVTAQAGQSVSVDMHIVNNPGISGARIKVSYGSGMTLTGVTAGEALSVLDFTTPAIKNPFFLNWDSLDQQSFNDGVVVTMTFNVSESVSVGDRIAIDCSYTNGDIFNYDLMDVTLGMTGGSVTVK